MSTTQNSGDAVPIGPGPRLECKVCWHVYDPAEGDEVWRIPPGTPFSELPDHWTCPNCSTTRDGFLVMTDD
jgi:rubredoxin